MKAKKHLAPNLEVFEAWKRTNTQSLPTTVPELTLLVEALRYRLEHIYRLGQAEIKYVDMAIRALTAL